MSQIYPSLFNPYMPAKRISQCFAIALALSLFLFGSVNAETFIVTNSNDSGEGSLRQAVEDAEDTDGADVIVFNLKSGDQPILLTSGQIEITQDLTIDASDLSSPITIDGGGEEGGSGIFYVEEAPLTLKNLTLMNAKSTEYGGAITSDEGTLTIDNCAFIDNVTEDCGGAIYFDGDGSLIIENSAFNGNAATYNGGSIYFDGEGTLRIEKSDFNDNEATEDGGAIYFEGDGSLIIENSAFNGNAAENNGGAIYENGGTINIENSSFDRNVTVNYDGGAIYTNGGTLNIVNSAFNGNAAEDNGGAIYANGGALNITKSDFIDNKAVNDGGAIYGNFGTLNIKHSALNGNAASRDGGAIYADGGTLNIEKSAFYVNTADDSGGAIKVYGYGAATILNSTFSGNTAMSEGGAIWGGDTTGKGTLDLQNCTLNGNMATNEGGAVYLFGDWTATVTNSTIANNFGLNGVYGYANSTIALHNSILWGTKQNDTNVDDCKIIGYDHSSQSNLIGVVGRGCELAALVSADPLLEALANNGDEMETMALMSGSPALKRGADHCLSTDQRGFSRATPCDLGAYESNN